MPEKQKRPRKNRPPHFFSAGETRFLRRKVAGRSYAELTALFNGHFSLSLTEGQIKNAASRNQLRNGRDCRFSPGQTSHNKGKKGQCAPGSEKGWFRPGQMPTNFKPVGSERVTRDGYVEVKTRNPKTWKQKHRVVWEQANGKIPKGHAVLFADGNRLNMAPDNLLLVSRGELVVMNHEGLIKAHKDLTAVGKTVADLKMSIAKRKKELKRK